jgi:hypothetical protein
VWSWRELARTFAPFFDESDARPGVIVPLMASGGFADMLDEQLLMMASIRGKGTAMTAVRDTNTLRSRWRRYLRRRQATRTWPPRGLSATGSGSSAPACCLLRGDSTTLPGRPERIYCARV